MDPSKMSADVEFLQIVKNIVREIVKELTKIPKFVVDQHLITYYVKLLLHDPNWHINGKVLLAREKIQKFIKFVVENFQREREPDIVIIKIQHSFFTTFSCKQDIVQTRRQTLQERLNPLKFAILEGQPTDVDLDHLYHQIVVYFTLVSGMGDPTAPEIYKHNKIVVNSVLTMDELKEFIHKPYVVRQEELSTLVKVCTGIRIFNMECQRGTKGVPNLPQLMFNAIEALSDFLEFMIRDVDQQINILSLVVSSCYMPYISKQQVLLKLYLPENSGVSENDVEYCKHLILVYKQLQEVIQFVSGDISTQQTMSLDMYQEYIDILAMLKSIVVPNFHIRVNIIFPHFVKLCEIWSSFQDIVVLLNIFKRVIRHLDRLVSKLEFDNTLVKHYFYVAPQKFYDESGLLLSDIFTDASADCRIYTENDLVLLRSKSDEKVFYEYEGHCCWKLVLTNGFLLKGNEAYGAVGYHSRFYIFSSPLALKCFIKEPDYYINYVLKLARQICGLIIYLKLSDDLMTVKDKLNLIAKGKTQTKTYKEVECQYDPDVEENIDRSYHHSIWKYKEEALQIAKVLNCKTVSTMTDKTFFKNSCKEQTYTHKEKDTSTPSIKFTNTPTPLSFIHGLRNDREGKRQAHLNLTYWEFKNDKI